MPIVNIIRRASNYILGSEELQEKNDTLFEDNEVLFCKNNVCVHPPALVRQESDILHYPGYLTVTTKTFTDQYNNAKRPTLLLTWIPNATLRKCPSTVENYGITSPMLGNNGSATNHITMDSIHSYTDELKQHKLYNQISDWNGSLNGKTDGPNSQQTCLETAATALATTMTTTATGVVMTTTTTTVTGVPIHPTNPFLDPYLYENEKMANNTVENMDTISVSSNSDRASSSGVHSTYGGDQNDEDVFCTDNLKKSMPNVTEEEESDEVKQLKCELEPLIGTDDGDNKAIVIINASKQNHVKSLLAQPKNSTLLTSVNITIANPQIQNQDLSPEELMLEQQQQNVKLMRTQSVNSVEESGMTSNWMTPELLAYKHNLAFPDSVTSSPILTRNVPMKCRRFSVDLSQMRSLRLFFNDENCTSGQLVIASRESQYKILHFHHGGLDHLAQVLHQWHCLLHNIKLAPNGGGGGGGGVSLHGHDEQNLPYRQFMVCRPEVKKSELHPDEGNVNKITTDYFYGTLLNEKGQIEDDLLLRKCVFFGGLEKSLRKAVWPFLLHCYSFNSTFEDRALLMDIRQQEYNELTRIRLYSMSPEEQAHFWRSVQCIIEKDVVRTDRSNPYFAGDDNPHIESMKNILLNYAFYNAGTSYTQGMSDLLAPVLCEIKNESETFWCFVGLMQRAFFVCTPTDNDIDKNLSYLRELIRVMVPKFHTHLEKYSDSKELLFCHRWILLCFKREFTEAVAIRMWEACWSNYLTDYFHLFLCLSIIAVYADDVVAQDLRTDEMLLHFSSLAMYMDGQLILRKARGLLYQFRQLPKIPCTLSNLCRRCGPGMWDSGHHPAIECIGHTDDDHCILSDE